ncbi:MAG: fibronectin type III domain-containing protein, partial [Paludibacteraceae bacterium]|nr:fibronectin type III domain-containing protein [Paludibacteraceae bacterium]
IGGCQDNDAPTMGAATLVRAGKSKVVLNLSATDDICVTSYQITGNINGTPVDMTVPAPGCGAAGEVTFNLPAEITGTHTLTVRAIDGTGKQSANTRTVNVTANTTGPTNVQATFGSSTPSSITLNNVSATPGTGGAIVAYKVTYGPNNEYSQTIVPNGNQLTVSALKTGTNYNGMRIYAIDDMGNVSTTYRTINTASTQNSAATSSVCAEVRAVNGELYGNWERFEQRAIISAGRSAADEFAILVTPYPGTWPLEGVYINTEAGNGIPGGDIIVNAEQGKIQSNSVVFQNTTGTVEFVDTQIGGTTVQSILVKVKYNTAVGFPQFYLGWRKVRTDNGNTTGRLTGEDGGFFYVNDQNSYCNNIAVDNQNFTANWPFGDPTVPDAPNVLGDDPVDTTPAGDIAANPTCNEMVYGTNFASTAGGDHLTIDDIIAYDVTHSSEKISVDPAFHEGYVNGGFMDDTDNYAIVENPHVLDSRLKEKHDGVNRLIFHLHKATDASQFNLLSLPLENLTPETKVTVRFDYEFVSDKRENGDWRAIAASLGNANVNATDSWSGSVELTGTALSTTMFSIRVWGSGNSDALAISNLRIYGCVDHTLQADVELPACEGTDVTLEAVGYNEVTTGFTWQQKVGNTWQTITGQTSNKLVVKAELADKKIRAYRGGYYTDVMDIQGVVCCDNSENKKVIWQEDFGTVPAWTRYQYPRQDNTENWVVGHAFRDYGTRPGCTTDIWIEDPVGSGNWVCPPENRVPISYFGYTDTPRDGSNPWYYGEGFGKVDDGDYAIVSNSTYAEDGCGWVLDRTDHTGNPNGGFLLINVAPTEHDPITGELIPTQIIEKEINNVKFCSGVWYNFSIWASQLAKRNQLPSSFYLEAWGVDAGGN